MNFRTINDLNRHISAAMVALPDNLDLIVGIPRSGLLPATIIALKLNIELTTVEGFLNGLVFENGSSRQFSPKKKTWKNVLVVDDSCHSGAQLAKVKARIASANLLATIHYFTVYVTPDSAHLVDCYANVCEAPRMFEWNVMHHPYLQNCCMDIDGVLCPDPLNNQNDDGPHYLHFLQTTRPLQIPTCKVGFLVTARLEKYRPETEAWLKAHKVDYGQLVMYPGTAEERRRSQGHGLFKASFYSKIGAMFFIESNVTQAAEIARKSKKPVLCSENMQVFYPVNKHWTQNLKLANVKKLFKRVWH